MKPTLISSRARPTMPAVAAAIAKHREGLARDAQASDTVASLLAMVVTEIMPSIVSVISDDQATQLRLALTAARGKPA